MHLNNFPKLHNATWPGVVGKGANAEPPISLAEMLQLTAAAEVDGVTFDGVDIGLFHPHVDIYDIREGPMQLASIVRKFGLRVGSLVAPVHNGSAIGSKEQRLTFVDMVRRACIYGKILRAEGLRSYGVIRIDSACSPAQWAEDSAGNTKKIAETFRHACAVAADYGEQLAAEGEICWGGMHSWRTILDTLEAVNRPNIGFQADMAHTMLYLLGYNFPEHRILPAHFDWSDKAVLADGWAQLSAALRPWTIDFHVAQNDGTVYGSGTHDKTGHHCPANDPEGKLDIVSDAGWWLRDGTGNITRAFRHICWDGCMFANDLMRQPQTWNDVLTTMIAVRNQHGWYEQPNQG